MLLILKSIMTQRTPKPVIISLKINGSVMSINAIPALLNKSETKSLNHSKTKSSKSQPSTFTQMFGNRIMVHVSKRTSHQKLKTIRLKRTTDLSLISHVQVSSPMSRQRVVWFKALMLQALLSRVMMERITLSDWVHAQDLKVKAKILFLKKEIILCGKVQNKPALTICTLAHAIDFLNVYCPLYFFLYFKYSN